MIAHHAIFMSLPMSALACPGHKWGRWWWRCHPDTDTRTHPVIIIRHKLSQLSLQSGRPGVVFLSLNPILSESHDCQVQAPSHINISALGLNWLFRWAVLDVLLSVTRQSWAQHILMMMVCNCVWWWDYNIIMMSIQISWPWPWTRSPSPGLASQSGAGAGKLITPRGGMGSAR